jgi:hypothetical protein
VRGGAIGPGEPPGDRAGRARRDGCGASVVGIDVDFTGRAVGDLVALVAIVRCDDDLLDANPPARDLPTILTTENRVALQVVEVRDPAT